MAIVLNVQRRPCLLVIKGLCERIYVELLRKEERRKSYCIRLEFNTRQFWREAAPSMFYCTMHILREVQCSAHVIVHVIVVAVELKWMSARVFRGYYIL